jgi:hypothetical protein
MFPQGGSQIFNEANSPEDSHFMEVENVPRDALNVARFRPIASSEWRKPILAEWVVRMARCAVWAHDKCKRRKTS